MPTKRELEERLVAAQIAYEEADRERRKFQSRLHVRERIDKDIQRAIDSLKMWYDICLQKQAEIESAENAKEKRIARRKKEARKALDLLSGDSRRDRSKDDRGRKSGQNLQGRSPASTGDGV